MAVSITTRILSPIILLIGTLVSGISPIAVTQSLLKCGCTKSVCEPKCKARKGKVVTSFLIYFGGGVLLATCLVHLLPEAREGFENYYDKQQDNNGNGSTTEATLLTTLAPNLTTEGEQDGDDHHEEFSLPEFIVCCGFFAVYLLEEIVHYALGSHGHSHIPSESRAIRSLSRSESCSSAKLSPEPIVIFNSSGKAAPSAESQEAICDSESTNGITSSEISITGLLTVVALSFHSLFEGFAIGIQGSDSRVWILFAAVAVHKFVIAFVVGLEVLTGGGRRTLVIIYMSVFAAMSPLGMIIASITKASLEDDNPLLVGILNAIATGTLLYVTFCEILQREEEHKNLSSWKQFIATILGFGVMCVVQYLTTLA